jgi:hypothetical protein
MQPFHYPLRRSSVPRAARQVNDGRNRELLKRDYINAIVGSVTDASDRGRLNAFFMVALALEDLFALEHQGDKPRRPFKAEYSQSTGVFPVFALTSTLPPEVAFLARAHVLAEFTPAGVPGPNKCLEASMAAAKTPPPPAHTVARILYNAHKTRPLQRKAFDEAILANDYILGYRINNDHEVTGYDGGNACWHVDQDMMDILWYARDAEPAYRIMDLQFVLPPKRAKLVAEAAMAAFADVYDAHLRSLKPRPAEELESYACAVIGANVRQNTIVVTDLFSPTDVNGWFGTMLKLLAELESRGGPRSAKSEPSFLMATRRH